MENTTANPVGWDIVDTASDSTTVAVAVESEPVHIAYKLGRIIGVAQLAIMTMSSSDDPYTVARGKYYEEMLKEAENLKVDYSRF